MSNFVNVNAWLDNFDSVFEARITYLDTLLKSFDCETGTDVELIESGSLKHFDITNQKNLAYVVASAASWSPPNGWNVNEPYPIVLPSSTSLYFTASCTFSPSTIVPITYKISLAFYSVIYKNGNDPNVPIDTNSYELNDTVTVLGQGDMVEPNGLPFAGWSLSADLSNPLPENATFLFSERINLYAVWGEVIETIKIYYTINNGDPQNYQETFTTSTGSVTVNLPSNFTKDNYVFAGWSTDNTNIFGSLLYGLNNLENVTISNTIQLYAAWGTETEIGIIYFTNEADQLDSSETFITITGRVSTILRSGLTKNGFTFSGWSLDSVDPLSNLTYPLLSLGDNVTLFGSVVLHAAWTPIIIDTFTVTYVNYNMDVVGSVPTDTSAYQLNDPVILADQGELILTPQYTFLGWSLTESGDVLESPYTITANTTFYAVFQENLFTIQYTYETTNVDISGLPPPNSAPLAYQSIVTLSNQGSLEWSGHVFLGWSLQGDTSETLYQAESEYTITENTIFNAVWGATFSVVYVTSIPNNDIIDITVYSYGDTFLLPLVANFEVLANHVFKNWVTDLNNPSQTIISEELNTNVITGDMVLYEWSVPNSFTITYDKTTGDGDAPLDPATYMLGETYPVSDQGDLTLSGYFFNGWVQSLSSPSTKVVSAAFKNNVIYTDNVTLYAWWLPLFGTTYSVTYTNTTPDIVNDPPVDPTLYPSGSTIRLLDQGLMTSTSNLIFNGWALNGIKKLKPFAITENITLVALWEVDAYTVTYVNNTSSIVADVPVDSTNYNSGMNQVTLQPILSWSSTTQMLGGWSLNSDLSGEIFQVYAGYTITEDVTFYAVWVQAFNVSFTSNNSAVTGTAEYPSKLYPAGFGTIFAGRGDLALPNYVFNGWSLNSDLSGELYQENFEFDLTQDVTFYAVWVPAYTVTFVNNDSNVLGTVEYDSIIYPAGSSQFLAGRGTLDRNNYTVVGWSLNSDRSGTVYPLYSSYTITENVTFYAVCQENPKYTVTYRNNYSDAGGSVPVETNTFFSGTPYTVLGGGTMVRTTYPNATFVGWYRFSSFTGTMYTSAGPTYTITANVIFYAKFV
jgi:hypothetical protein